jgi:hypothetical protein
MMSNDRNDKDVKTQTSIRKTYSKPCTLSKEPLEAMAVVCSGGGAKANAGVCPAGPVTS